MLPYGWSFLLGSLNLNLSKLLSGALAVLIQPLQGSSETFTEVVDFWKFFRDSSVVSKTRARASTEKPDGLTPEAWPAQRRARASARESRPARAPPRHAFLLFEQFE